MKDYEIQSSSSVFSEYRPYFLAQLESLLESLQEIFSSRENLDLNIQGRVKKVESFKKKLEKKKDKYKDPFCDMTDIIGIRIISNFKDEADEIANLLKENFQIDLENSSNKFKMLDYDRMGYISLHYICSFKKPKKALDPKLLEIMDNLKFEVQIRTSLQHTWAEVDHRLRYKTLVDVPNKVKRKLFRLSALFEMADSELCHIRDEVKALENFYEEKFSAKNYNLRLDLSTINYYIKYNDKRIGEILKLMHVKHFNTFDVAKEEKLEKKVVKYANKFGLNDVKNIDSLIHCILSHQADFMTYIDGELKRKLSYLINSSCTFILNLLLLAFEERDALKAIYNLSEESLDSIMALREKLDFRIE